MALPWGPLVARGALVLKHRPRGNVPTLFPSIAPLQVCPARYSPLFPHGVCGVHCILLKGVVKDTDLWTPFTLKVIEDSVSMKSFAKLVLATLFVSLVLTLQGCGCDEGAAKKCTKTTCKDITDCFKSADCCDYEKDGQKIKDSMKVICDAAGKSGDNACA